MAEVIQHDDDELWRGAGKVLALNMLVDNMLREMKLAQVQYADAFGVDPDDQASREGKKNYKPREEGGQVVQSHPVGFHWPVGSMVDFTAGATLLFIVVLPADSSIGHVLGALECSGTHGNFGPGAAPLYQAVKSATGGSPRFGCTVSYVVAKTLSASLHGEA